MASEGAREIEAAKRLLAAAKLQVKSLEEGRNNAAETVRAQQKSLDVAKKCFMAAQSQLSRSQQEVKDAERFLAESEKRWEVISIDIADDDASTNNNNKRRKVSVSPQTKNDAPKTRTKWQCDYCKDAYCTFDYDDCLRHENECRDKLRKAFYKIVGESDFDWLDERLSDDEPTKLVRKRIKDIVMNQDRPTIEGVTNAIQNSLGIDLSQNVRYVFSIILQSNAKKLRR